jgi:AcrR family transcriptional regulator
LTLALLTWPERYVSTGRAVNPIGGAVGSPTHELQPLRVYHLAVPDLPVREGLRERKKRLTRDTLTANALRLFEQRGFDHVTTAEIADASNVAVKTLFVYFPTKEDLVFADEQQILERLRSRLRGREPGSSEVQAVRSLAHDLIAEERSNPIEGLGSFARLIGDNATLHSRLQVMWERWEQAVAEVLAEERGGAAHHPEVRIRAALLVAPFRVLTSSDVRNQAEVAADVSRWLDQSFDLIASGLGE